MKLYDRIHDKIYCSKTITVVRPGETIIPEATESANVGTQTTNISIGQPLDLCQSIPPTAPCGEGNENLCQKKCIECTSNTNIKGGIWTAIGCLPTSIQDLVSKLFTIFSGLLGGFIFICIMWNGIKVMLSRGSPDAFKKAQEAITSCIIGLLVLLFSVLFLKVVGVDILKIPGFQ